MKRLISRKSLAAAAVALGAFAAASLAHARSDVYFSIGVQAPGVYEEPAPVYVQPAPVYVQPAPVYAQPRPAYVAPRHVYVDPRPAYVPGPGYYGHRWERRGPYGDYDRDGIANVYDPDSPRHHRRYAHRYGPWGDLDRDGILNQDDRDRDGDGVRNRHDRFPDHPYRY